MLAGDSMSTSAGPALAHGASSSVCVDCHHTGGGTPVTLRDAVPVLGRFANTTQGS